jgi:phosphoribosylformimino-5-aminoimidazole carboxamide ribonucleotide (ProFAR) isomerase
MTVTISGLQALLALGVLAATLVGSVVSAYVSLTHRGVDKATTDQITLDVDQRQDARHAWRYERMLQLEEFADHTQAYHREDQTWHREITAILREARDAGFIPIERKIPDPPVPPVLPPPPAHATQK